MKDVFAALAILSFVSVAIFGFLAMDMNNLAGGHQNCIAETANANGLCPNDIIDLSFFHVNTYKSFSLAVFASFLALLLIAGFLWIKIQNKNFEFLEKTFFTNLNLAYKPSQEKTFHWISLLENSPSLLSRAL